MTRPRDDWDATAYDDDHSFVYEYGADLLELLEPTADERVLDLGCGTGELTAAVSDAGATAVGLDSSAEMIATAREAHPDCSFVHADATTFAAEEPFDAVLSNAALHWIDDQDAVLETVRDALRPGGRFVAELGGTGNVRAIVDALAAELADRGYDGDHSWYFPSIGEYAPRIEAHGFEVHSAALFDRPTELENGADGLANWIGMFGDEFFEGVPDAERDTIVEGVEDRLRPALFRDGSWVADYRRLRFVAVADPLSKE
ncbi:methyltransferase domain-containing protein [Natronococcus sp. A-GB1]|uniref:class I SAM-dependent methyltransferase n=1 Tax=Natronococcus sp. A-GB1 TaxID=3037648 RepID=UPI00241FB8BC|nr:methyltransferase domain-containing protein [Natronococcus sp. A-GB1]MDG5759886.1 methyltransferase domain-containing protein [Natronococcus sp. A-GB1]